MTTVILYLTTYFGGIQEGTLKSSPAKDSTAFIAGYQLVPTFLLRLRFLASYFSEYCNMWLCDNAQLLIPKELRLFSQCLPLPSTGSLPRFTEYDRRGSFFTCRYLTYCIHINSFPVTVGLPVCPIKRVVMLSFLAHGNIDTKWRLSTEMESILSLDFYLREPKCGDALKWGNRRNWIAQKRVFI